TRIHPERKPLVRAPSQGPDAIERMKWDTFIGMAFSNIVALAMLLATAATLHASGITYVQTSTQAAEALRPVCVRHYRDRLARRSGPAGSAAYAVGEASKWPVGLSRIEQCTSCHQRFMQGGNHEGGGRPFFRDTSSEQREAPHRWTSGLQCAPTYSVHGRSKWIGLGCQATRTARYRGLVRVSADDRAAIKIWTLLMWRI